MLKKYETSDMGMLHHFLGMEIYQEEEGVYISQKNYAEKILKKFGMHECKPVATPLVVNEKLMKDNGTKKVDATLYRSLVGNLLYLTATRPDIMFATSLLSRFMHCPSQTYLGAAERVLRYLQGTVNFGVRYERNLQQKLVGYCDSDWGGCFDDMKSTSGYAFSFGSGVFSWASENNNQLLSPLPKRNMFHQLLQLLKLLKKVKFSSSFVRLMSSWLISLQKLFQRISSSILEKHWEFKNITLRGRNFN